MVKPTPKLPPDEQAKNDAEYENGESEPVISAKKVQGQKSFNEATRTIMKETQRKEQIETQKRLRSKNAQRKKAGEAPSPDPPPVSLKISHMNTEGDLSLKFNQEMVIPPFVEAMNLGESQKGSNRRVLASLDEIDPSEFLEIIVVKKGNEPPSDSQFSTNIKKWTPQGIVMKMNFDKPLSVSNGRYTDKMRIKIKEPEYFISAVTGEMILPENTISPAVSIPS